MNNSIHIDEKSHDILNRWSAENKQVLKDFVLSKHYYFDKCVLTFEDTYIVYFTVAKNKVKWSCKKDKVQILKGSIVDPIQGDTSDIGIRYHIITRELTAEFAAYLAQIFVSDFLAVNCIFYFGNIVDSNAKLQARTVDDDKHYFIREYNGRIYAVNSHNHRSPEGVFGVRGHFRKYKNGKIIWIDEYLKGTKNEKDKRNS